MNEFGGIILKFHPFNLRKRLIALSYRQKKFDKVIDASEKYLKEYPDDIEILELRGRASVSSKEWNTALTYYCRIFDIDPSYRDVAVQFARCAIYVKKWHYLERIIEKSPHALMRKDVQMALEKKIVLLDNEDYKSIAESAEKMLPFLPQKSLKQWANLPITSRPTRILYIDKLCMDEKIGGCYLGLMVEITAESSIENANKIVDEFLKVHPTPSVAEWIGSRYTENEELFRPIFKNLLEITPLDQLDELYNQIGAYIPMEEFVELEHLETLASVTEIAHVWLVDTLCIHNKPKILNDLIERNLPNTSSALEETLRRNIINHRVNITIWLLEIIQNHPLLSTIHSLRRIIAKALFSAGALELSYEYAIETIRLYPQDGVSAFVALNAAIELVDDERIFHAADINLNLRHPNPKLNHAAIIAACLRNGKEELATDAMERFRMKMDRAGHRLRVGYQFHHLNDWKGTIKAVETTPTPYQEEPHLILMQAASCAMLGYTKKSVKVCNLINNSSESLCSKYSIHHLLGDYSSAFAELNSHFEDVYGVGLSKTWLNNSLNYFKLKSKKPKAVESGPLVSVIMTIHQWNDAFPLAINSVLNQSYSNIELLLIDDASASEDVNMYQPYLVDSRIRYHRVYENQGTYACRNEGISMAMGEYITFADSDDWNHPCRIEAALNELIENDAYMTHGRYIRMKSDGGMNIDGGRPARFALMSMFWRASILKENLGGFDGRARFSADSELYERARVFYGSNLIMRSDRIEVIALSHESSLTGGGSTAIDWLGPGPSRVRYVSGYQRWHDKIKKSDTPPILDSEPPFPKPSKENTPEKFSTVKKLESLFNFSPKKQMNSQQPQLETTPQAEITIGMATYPGGFSTLRETVESLIQQSLPFTRLRIHINGKEKPPKLPSDSRIEIYHSKKNMTDIGKFNAVSDFSGYILTVDDDITYPYDYIERMISEVDFHDRNCLIGVHGAILPTGPAITRWSDYSLMRRSHVFETHVFSRFGVNVIGTGTLAYHTDVGVIPWDRFDHGRMVDLHIAVWCQENNIPMKLVSRKRKWLIEMNEELDDRIWQTVNIDKELQWQMIEVLQRCKQWKLLPIIEMSVTLSNSPLMKNWDSRELPPGISLPNYPIHYSPISNPLVTIYIPMYNAESYIEDTITSAFKQTYRNTEICVHDDGSTDSSLEIVKRLYGKNPKVIISSSTNNGIGSASNQAIRAGTGDLILQLDSDDLIEPEAAEILVTEFHQNPDSVCCYGNFRRIDSNGNEIDEGWEHPTFCRRRLLRSMIAHHPRMFRRDAFENTGGFNEQLINAVDYDFFLRLSLQGPMSHVRKSLYSYRIHGESTSISKTTIQDKNTLLVQELFLAQIGQGESYYPVAPNIRFPRRVTYALRWSIIPEKVISSPVITTEEIIPEIAIELSKVELHFPRSKSLLRGVVNLLRGPDQSNMGLFTALQGIDLEIKQGEVLGIIGRNGSGKSTMVRVMAGVYRPDDGSVKVRGRTTLLAGVTAGLNQNLTGRENVHLYGSILGHDKETMDGMMDEILEFSEIGEFIEQPLRTYSSGMRARLGIAIASAIEPEILLIDEVLGVGDPEFREKSKKRILDLVKSTGTVVIVSHSFGLMKEICDRLVLVHGGAIIQIGDPKRVIASYYELNN